MNPVPVGTIVRVQQDFSGRIPQMFQGRLGAVSRIRPAGTLYHVNVILFGQEHPVAFAWSELELTGTIHEPAPQTIDHGRIGTLKRREMFSKVHVEMVDKAVYMGITLPTETMLSPRRIYRILEAKFPEEGGRAYPYLEADLALAAHELLSMYRDEKFQLEAVGTRQVLGWTIHLVPNEVTA